jgi:hypothetical protein
VRWWPVVVPIWGRGDGSAVTQNNGKVSQKERVTMRVTTEYLLLLQALKARYQCASIAAVLRLGVAHLVERQAAEDIPAGREPP